MSLITKLKAEITHALINSQRIKQDILKLLLSECQRANKYEDDFINKVAQKLVDSNNETIRVGGPNGKLLEENSYLSPYIAQKLTLREVKGVAVHYIDEIIGAKTDGQAIGLLSKMVKQETGKTADGNDLKECVNTIRDNVYEGTR